MLEKKISQKENLKKCITFEEQKGTRYIQGNIYFWHYSSSRHPLRSIKHFLAKIHLQFFSILTDKFVCSAWSSLLAWYWFCFKSIWKMPWMGCYGLPFFYLCNWSRSTFGNLRILSNCTLSMQERVFVGHEIFFKVFDGPQNIFLCSIFTFVFFFFFWVKGDGAQNIQTSHQGDLRKTRHVK